MLHCDVPCLLHRIHYCELSYFNFNYSNIHLFEALVIQIPIYLELFAIFKWF